MKDPKPMSEKIELSGYGETSEEKKPLLQKLKKFLKNICNH
jgi:hypothetical protein